MLSGSSLFVAPAHIPELTKCKNLGWMADLGWCGGWDLNPRTPTGQGPEPCAFDLSWQPPRVSEREIIWFDKGLSRLHSAVETPRVDGVNRLIGTRKFIEANSSTKMPRRAM